MQIKKYQWGPRVNLIGCFINKIWFPYSYGLIFYGGIGLIEFETMQKKKELITKLIK